MLGPIVFVAWVALISLFVVGWSRFAGRRRNAMRTIEADRQRHLDNELTDLTMSVIRVDRADSTPDPTSAGLWGEFDRSARS